MRLFSNGTKKSTKVIIISVIAVVVLAIIASVIFFLIPKGSAPAQVVGNAEVSESAVPEPTEDELLIESATLLMQQYDYDAALELISELEGDDAKALAEEIEEIKETLTEADLHAIPHIFFHSLIADTSKAFDGDYKEAGYNQVMTTIPEFNAIINEMYNRGFVLVSLHDIATFGEDGTVTAGKIMLPPGKRPFVLSVDDVNYYEYMEGDGFASRIVIGEDGKPTCEMKQDDGSVITGDFDVVPLLDKFVEEHPDFSYRGAKGILALTGYEGVMGYRTCPSYSDNPTYEEDIAAAKAVAQNLRDYGWEFASHSWGHRDMGTMAFENLKTDTKRWEDEVETIIGDTDILIFPFGADIDSWKSYKPDNERFKLLKSVGFDYYCNVDGNRAWLQIGNNYVRQGRRNLDGYKMYYDMINDNKDWLSDLIDVKAVFDKDRPTPVPPM